jgi:hypothetical protein
MIGQLRQRLQATRERCHAKREQWRKARLRFWLRRMAACEESGLTDCEIYYWYARRAMACNAWRKT